MSQTVTPGGSALIRPVGTSGKRNIDVDGRYRDEIVAHVETHIGPIAGVLHEKTSEYVHLDLLVVSPNEQFPFTTLVTSGMSDRIMHTPYADDEARDWQSCELLIGLPADWNGGSVDTWTDETSGPIGELLAAARYPHACDTWIGPGHTIAASSPGLLGPWTEKFGGLLVDWPYVFSPDVGRLQVSPTETVNFYGLYFITPKELSYKLAKGVDALTARLADSDVSIVLDPSRTCTAPKRGWLWQAT